MASLCKRQQCTIDRRGFRQELDSWRHKLIHCVGFESILEGLFGPELVEDFQLVKDREPLAVSDWSFDENCIFCCLRRDKVKEHLSSLNNEGLEDPPKPLLVKDQALLSRLERQAEEFLSAVLRRKDVPNFSDPHVPVVAREILQRMIRQFAAEYTSKTSPSQDSVSDSQPHSDQSLSPEQPLSTSPAAPPAVSAHNQNPVLSKLLMIDQDAPLDLTIKKPPAEPSEQDGVLDLSIKKNRNSSFTSARSSCLSPVTSTPKGEPREVQITKAKELQSASTLEQFMSKLCLHHQRQIIDAIGFLQAEVKGVPPSKSSQSIKSTPELQETSYSPVKPHAATPTKPSSEPCKPYSNPEVQDRPHSNSSSCPKLKLSVTPAPPLDISRTSPAPIQSFVAPTAEAKNSRHVDHAPLKMKIMKTGNVAAGNKLSCVLTTSLSPHSLDDRPGNSSSSKTEAHSARLSSSFIKHNELSHTHPIKQREVLGHAEDRSAKHYSLHVSISSNSPRTARKSLRPSSEHRNSDFLNRVIVDPDLGHCDIVYINKPITFFQKRHRGMVPRRNARKSTRGHMYADDTWELKTVRTLAGRGNCPNPMLEFNTSVTPKQNLSKPEGVPPVDMPCARECREAMDQQISTQEPAESELPETGQAIDTAASDVDVIVETSQTDQSQVVEESVSPSPVRQVENMQMSVEQDAPAEIENSNENEDNVAQVSVEEKQTSQDAIDESVLQILSDTVAESVEESIIKEADGQASSDNIEAAVEQIRSPSPVKEVSLEESERDKLQDEPNQDSQTAETNNNTDSPEEKEESCTTGPAAEDTVTERETEVEGEDTVTEKETEVERGDTVTEKETKVEGEDTVTEKETKVEGEDTVTEKETKVEGEKMIAPECEKAKQESDLSSKTLEDLSKELPPWRKKKGTVISEPKHIEKTEEVIVGFVSGRPVSASDRSLRRRSGQTLPPREIPAKRGQKVQNKTDVNSNSESSNLDKPLTEAPEPEKTDSSPSIPPLTDMSSDTPASPKSKMSPRKSKVVRKSSFSEQSTISTRHLRSSGQKLGESPTIPLTSNSVTSTSSSEPFEPSVTSPPLVAESTEQESCPPESSTPLPISLPSSVEALPQTEVVSELSTPTDTTVESKIDEQAAEPTNSEPQSKAGDSLVQSKPTLRSAKPIPEASKNEKSDSGQLITPESPIKSEPQPQAMALRSKRTLQKEAEPIKSSPQQKSSVEPPSDSSSNADPNTEKPTRMPLRSESNRSEQSPPAEDKRLSLRSQRQAPTTRPSEMSSPIRMTKTQVRLTQTPSTSAGIVFTSKSEPPKQASVKFLEALNGGENQQVISNLNLKFDKMHKGWLQMEREGQPAPKHKNKADRQAAIWKSKRRTRKPKSLENQKYSPVQMLFMKAFDLSSICRWFLESTETKSLVIVKKVNTRLPSETQLCFHSSGAAGSSQGVYPSLQAERLKKHLKKFAIASPVKSNPKSQKLIAKALEQEIVNLVKGKEKKELSNIGLKKTHASAKRESQKPKSCKTQNPASARILRKYSNIREKMQVQHANARLKNKTKVKASLKALTKDPRKSNIKASLKTSSLHVRKRVQSAAKIEKKKALAEKSNQQKSTKQPAKDEAVKASSSKQVLKDEVKKELPKRTSQRLGSPSASETSVNVDTPTNKADRKVEEKKDTEIKATKAKAAKVQKESSDGAETRSTDNPDAQCVDKVPSSPDQVLTRSQSKMEAASSASVTPTSVSKKARSVRSTKPAVPAEEPALTRSGALKLSAKRSQTTMLPRSASKKAQELIEPPAKRTRTK